MDTSQPMCPSDDSPLTVCDKPGHYWCDAHYHWVSFAAAHDLHLNIMDIVEEAS